MSLTQSYPFDTPANYTFDAGKVEITGGVAKLKAPFDTNNPTIKPVTALDAEGLDSFLASITTAGSDAIKFVMEIDGTDKYWNGSAWIDSSGYAQSNTAAEVETNKASLNLSGGVDLKFKAFLHSDDGSTTPQLDTVSMEYDFKGDADAAPATCIVYGFVVDGEGNTVSGAEIAIWPDSNQKLNGKNYQMPKKINETTSASDGYWELELIRSSEFDPSIDYHARILSEKPAFKFLFKGITVPDEDTKEFNDIATVVT